MVANEVIKSAAEHIRALNGRLRATRAVCVGLAALASVLIIAGIAARKDYGRRKNNPLFTMSSDGGC